MTDVCYVGNFSASHSTENDVRRAFEHLGHQVDPVEETQALFWLQSVEGFARLRDRMLDTDLVLHTMTQGAYGPGMTDLWACCAEAGIPTASIHLDLFYGLSSPKDSGPQRCDLPRLHPMFRVDHVFTADGGHDAEFARDGVNHHWLPPAVCHAEAVDVAPNRERWPQDVAFVGSTGYHPEWWHRDRMVTALAKRYGDRFVHVGNGGQPTVRGLALNELYASVPVIVGDYCFAQRGSRYWSDRFCEVWGRGGYLVFPQTDALAEQVGPYPSWDVAQGFDAMCDAIDLALGDAYHRDGTRERLAAVIRAEHTYLNRVQTILDVTSQLALPAINWRAP